MDEEALLVIRRWIRKAEHDLATASVVLENKPEVTDTVCFHAQQCVEKSLKAYLTFAGVHVARTSGSWSQRSLSGTRSPSLMIQTPGSGSSTVT